MGKKLPPHPTRIYHQPEELLEVWNQYKAHLKEEAKNWPKVQYVGKFGQRVEDHPILPLTFDGFVTWHYNTFKKFVKQYFKNETGLYNEFMPICSHIKDEIRAHQITGGLLGNFNPSITQRLNGLKDQVEESGSKEMTIRVKYERKDNNAAGTTSGTAADTERET